MSEVDGAMGVVLWAAVIAVCVLGILLGIGYLGG
jgi:hypothetical protein